MPCTRADTEIAIKNKREKDKTKTRFNNLYHMYIAHSALQPDSCRDLSPEPKTAQTATPGAELQLRYQAYQAVCSKYQHEIAAIRQFFPNWAPSPPAP